MYRVEIVLIVTALNTVNVYSEIECGYQRCNSSFQTCGGDTIDTKRCYQCSDYIHDFVQDCNTVTVPGGCMQYCLDNLKIMAKKNHNSQKETEEHNIKKELVDQKRMSVAFQILFAVSSSLLVIFIALYWKEKRKRSKDSNIENTEMVTTDTNVEGSFGSRESDDSGINERLIGQDTTISDKIEVPQVVNIQEQDRLRQVKPKHGENQRVKVVPSGHLKSNTDLSLGQQY